MHYCAEAFANDGSLPSLGSLRRAYELIGYGRPDQFGPIDLCRRTQALRDELITQITSLFPGEVSVIRRGGRWRSRLRMRNALLVSVLIARCVHVWKESVRWQLDPVRRESRFITLLARLDEDNQSFLDFHILPAAANYQTVQWNPLAGRRRLCQTSLILPFHHGRSAGFVTSP